MSAMRYCLRNDDDAHWYLVPVDKTSKFAEYVDLQETSEEVSLPKGCKMVQIRNLTFTDPKEK